jgi:ABC-type Na+ efflux pump permease subunit
MVHAKKKKKQEKKEGNADTFFPLDGFLPSFSFFVIFLFLFLFASSLLPRPPSLYTALI